MEFLCRNKKPSDNGSHKPQEETQSWTLKLIRLCKDNAGRKGVKLSHSPKIVGGSSHSCLYKSGATTEAIFQGSTMTEHIVWSCASNQQKRDPCIADFFTWVPRWSTLTTNGCSPITLHNWAIRLSTVKVDFDYHAIKHQF